MCVCVCVCACMRVHAYVCLRLCLCQNTCMHVCSTSQCCLSLVSNHSACNHSNCTQAAHIGTQKPTVSMAQSLSNCKTAKTTAYRQSPMLLATASEQDQTQSHVLQEDSRFIFVPGPGDPGPGSALPRPPLPAYFTSDLRQLLPTAVFASNPCRIRLYTQEVVLFRSDLQNHMRRLCLIPPRSELLLHLKWFHDFVNEGILSSMPFGKRCVVYITALQLYWVLQMHSGSDTLCALLMLLLTVAFRIPRPGTWHQSSSRGQYQQLQKCLPTDARCMWYNDHLHDVQVVLVSQCHQLMPCLSIYV